MGTHFSKFVFYDFNLMQTLFIVACMRILLKDFVSKIDQ